MRATASPVSAQPINVEHLPGAAEPRLRRTIIEYRVFLLLPGEVGDCEYDWKPEGSLKTKSLQQFIQELPTKENQVTRLFIDFHTDFPVKSFNKSCKREVNQGNEEEWEKAKVAFFRHMDYCKQNANGNGLKLIMDITMYCELPDVQLIKVEGGEWAEDEL